MKPIQCLYCNQASNNESYTLKSRVRRIRCFNCRVTYSIYEKEPEELNRVDLIQVNMEKYTLVMQVNPLGDANLFPKRKDTSYDDLIMTIPVSSIIHLPLEKLKHKIMRLVPFT